MSHSKIILVNGSWHIIDATTSRSDLIVEMEAGQDGSKTPLGRHNWKTLNTACNQDRLEYGSLTLSKCVVGEDFSCDSGECVGIFQRCDNNEDCSDGSDEKNCKTIRIPPSYAKSSPPELRNELMESNPIFTQIDILNVDFIDTISMSVGLTMDIYLTWRDPKLTFENILTGKERFDMFKMISKAEFGFQ